MSVASTEGGVDATTPLPSQSLRDCGKTFEAIEQVWENVSRYHRSLGVMDNTPIVPVHGGAMQKRDTASASDASDASAASASTAADDVNGLVLSVASLDIAGGRNTDGVQITAVVDRCFDDGVYSGGIHPDGSRHGWGVMRYTSKLTSTTTDGVSGGSRDSKVVADASSGDCETNSKQNLHEGDEYEGLWVRDQRHGIGRYRFSSGDCYTGEFHEDKRQGWGMHYYLPSKDRYIGEWCENRRHGQGEYWHSTGDRFVGSYVQELKHGCGVFHVRDGRQVDIEFNMGVLVRK